MASNSRRSFLSTVVSMTGLAAVPAAAQQPAGPSGSPAGSFDLTWIDQMKGQHKQVHDFGTHDLSGFGAKARVILRAMQRYGLILADNGSNWFFQGTRDDHWTNRLLDQLKTVPASAFEAVDVSACMVRPNSGRADCPA